MGKTSTDLPPSSIQERIKLWQEHGGGVVEVDGLVEEPSDFNFQERSLELDTSSSHVQNVMNPIPEQRRPFHTPSRRSEKRLRHETIRLDSRPRSAPTKRVVSDGHWRKQSKEARSSIPAKEWEGDVMRQDDEQNQASPVGIIDFQAHSSLMERRERRKRRTQSTLETRQQTESGKGSCGHRRNSVSRDLDEAEKENFVQAGLTEKSLSVHPDQTRRERKRTLSNGHQAESPPTILPNRQNQRSLRLEKGNALRRVLSDSKRALTRQPAEPIVIPRIPSIQAWLDCTPDPFGGDGLLPVDSIENHESPVAPEAHGLKEPMEDPNLIWKSINNDESKEHRRASRKHRKRQSSLLSDLERKVSMDMKTPEAVLPSDMQEEIHQNRDGLATKSSETTSQILKRRPARKSMSSPVARDSRASPSSSMIDRREHNLDRASLQDQPSAHLESPIVRRRRTKDRKKSVRNGFQASASPAEEESAALISKPDITSESPLLVLGHGQDLANVSATCSNSDYDGDGLQLGRRTSRLTKHSDLISVLSMPIHKSRSTRSSRNPGVLANASECSLAQDIMIELEKEEIKYTRELRTLIDGVVPVLLTCVLSKAESAVAAGLFRSADAATHDPNVTRPIVDMAIALERLKSLHRRIPLKHPSSLLTWAHGAKRVYAEYLKAWRLGFQDVIVNLAPATEISSSVPTPGQEDLPRDHQGDLVNSDGEKVDVAFLLKRPLVRLKHLASTINAVNRASPSAEAAQLALDYDTLVDRARARVEEERARLEDEAAANIDATRSRDPRSLAPVSGVLIDSTRRVRARDYFSCSLQHSTGQSLDCQVELILREETTDSARGGDLLICEVDGTGRWLLFPPFPASLISTRTGETNTEMVLMIRGSDGAGNQWQELLLLTHFEEPTVIDWKNMLGSDPVPPVIARSQSFMVKAHVTSRLIGDTISISNTRPEVESQRSIRPPSPSEIQVPIGEQANAMSNEWPSYPTLDDQTIENGAVGNERSEKETGIQPLHATEDPRDAADGLNSLPSQQILSNNPISSNSPKPLSGLNERLGLGETSSVPGLRRKNAKRQSRHYSESNVGSGTSSSLKSARFCDSSEITGESVEDRKDKIKTGTCNAPDERKPRVNDERQNLDLKKQNPSTANQRPRTPGDYGDQSNTAPSARRGITEQAQTQWKSHSRSRASGSDQYNPIRKPVAPSRVRSPSSSSGLTKAFSTGASSYTSDIFIPTATETRVKNSSSPLKRQYDPSVDTETTRQESDMDDSASAHDDVSSMTESSDDDDFEADDVPMPLVPPIAVRRPLPNFPKPSTLSAPEGSIKPSDSASQAPYKTVPEQRQEAVRTVASLFAWSDKGSWEVLHPDECSIVVSPGLIEAFEMSASHSNGIPLPETPPIKGAALISDDMSQTTGQNDEVQGERPLVALELTPLVPLRRGTAIDISIRSPPTSKSRITTSNNLMFRSRSAEECEALYAMINHARIHNPTYIALQNARGPFFMGATYADAVGGRPSSQATSARSSWFGALGRSSSYRAKSKRTPSISPSQSSVGTMSSAFSALRRFGRGNGGKFNIALSTISSRQGIGSDAGTYSISDNSSAKDMATPMAAGMVANNDGSLGLKDAKIRLYLRENASRWRDLGSARLTILQPENDACGMRGDGQVMREKRILIHGKTKGEILLDAQLGESSFERVARTGIAVSIWEDVVGPNGEVGRAGAVGGVAAVKTKIYMIQLKSEAETAYTFSLVGKLRY